METMTLNFEGIGGVYSATKNNLIVYLPLKK